MFLEDRGPVVDDVLRDEPTGGLTLNRSPVESSQTGNHGSPCFGGRRLTRPTNNRTLTVIRRSALDGWGFWIEQTWCDAPPLSLEVSGWSLFEWGTGRL